MLDNAGLGNAILCVTAARVESAQIGVISSSARAVSNTSAGLPIMCHVPTHRDEPWQQDQRALRARELRSQAGFRVRTWVWKVLVLCALGGWVADYLGAHGFHV